MLLSVHDGLDKLVQERFLSTTNLVISRIKRSNLMVFALVINNYIYVFVINEK